MKNIKIPNNLFFLILICFIFGGTLYLEAATFTVTSFIDPGAGSLSTAIISANTTPGRDTIIFAIPPGGPVTIRPTVPLPPLTDRAGVLIDGFSQGGAPGPNPPATAMLVVELSGSAAGPGAHGIWIVSPNNTIQGMVIDSFSQDGIRIEGTRDTTYNNYIYSNFIGTDMMGIMNRGNGWNGISPWAGVDIVVNAGDTAFTHSNVVEGNISSCNYAQGVSISSCPPGDNHSNLVLKNHLGTDITGMAALGNSCDGVYIGEAAHHNVVDSNLISDNRTEGVCIVGYVNVGEDIYWYTTDNTVSNNVIGLAVDRATPMANWREGVSIGIYFGTGAPAWYLGYATNNIIGPNNIIAHNDSSGVIVWEHPSSNSNADGNQITQNSIYNNGISGPSRLGIDLDKDGVTLNDPGDPDDSANQDLNFPVIDSAVDVAGQTTVYGRVDIDTDPTQAFVEVFKARADPSGYGEGQVYLGSATPSNASGDWSVIIPGLTAGDTITATTTDMNFNTSEFSLNYVVTASAGVREIDEENILKVSSLIMINSVDIIFKVESKSGVRVDIYDLSGKLINSLVNEILEPSTYSVTWNGTNMNGVRVPAGIYLCSFESPDVRASEKLLKVD